MLDVAGAAVIVVETEDVDGVSGFAQYHYSGLTFTCSISGGGGDQRQEKQSQGLQKALGMNVKSLQRLD